MSQSKAGRPGRFHKAVATHLAQLRDNLFTEHDSDVQRLKEEVDLLKAKLANRDSRAPEDRSDGSNSIHEMPPLLPTLESRTLEDVDRSSTLLTEVESLASPVGPRSTEWTVRDTHADEADLPTTAGDPGCRSPSPFANGSSLEAAESDHAKVGKKTSKCLTLPGEQEMQTPRKNGSGQWSPRMTALSAGAKSSPLEQWGRTSGVKPSTSFKASKAMGWLGQALGVNRISTVNKSSSARPSRASRASHLPRSMSFGAARSVPLKDGAFQLGNVGKKASVHRKSKHDNDSDSSYDYSDDDAEPFSTRSRHASENRKTVDMKDVESKDSEIVEFKVASAWLKYDGRKTRFGRVSGLDPNSVESAVKAFKDGKKQATKDALGAWCENGGRSQSVFHQPSIQPPLPRTGSTVMRSVNSAEKVSLLLKNVMLTPSSLKHIFWELCGLVLIIFDAVNIPMDIFRPPETWLTSVSMWLPCFFWLLDIILNFCTGYLTPDGTRVMNRSLVACRYARTWLPFDFLLMICNWVAVLVHSTPTRDGFRGLQVWRALTLFRVLNIVRLVKAPELEGFVAEHIRSEMTRLIAEIGRNIVVLLVTAHVIACAWYGLGRHIVDEGDTTSWVYVYDLENRDVWYRYTFSIHWSLALFAGENIAESVGLAERIFAIVIFVFAFLFSAIFVSSITTLMTRLQIIAGKQSSQLNALRRYLVDKCISSSLTVRILRNAKHSMEEKNRNTSEASVELLKGISEPLRVELHFEVYFPVLSFHPFFKHYNTINPAGMRKVCHHAVSLITLSTGDILFSEGETPERPRMLFVVSGQVLYYQEVLQECTELRRGMWLCEATLWTTWLHYCGTLRGVSESSLLALDAGKFQKILRPFPTPHARQYGEFFVTHMNTAGRSSLTDLPDIDVDDRVAKVFPEFMKLQDFGAQNSWAESLSRQPSGLSRGLRGTNKFWGIPKSILPFSS